MVAVNLQQCDNAALRYRAVAALAKGATMGVFRLWVIGIAFWHALHGRQGL